VVFPGWVARWVHQECLDLLGWKVDLELEVERVLKGMLDLLGFLGYRVVSGLREHRELREFRVVTGVTGLMGLMGVSQ